LLSENHVDENHKDLNGHSALYYLKSIDPLGTGPLTEIFNRYLKNSVNASI